MEREIKKNFEIPLGYHQKVKQYLEKNSTGQTMQGIGFDNYPFKDGGSAIIVDVKSVVASVNMSERVEKGLLKIIGSK